MLLRLKILQAGVLVEWKVSSPLSGRQQILERTGKNGSVALTMVLRGSLLHVTQTETSRHNSTVCTRRIPLLLHMLMCHSPMLLIFQLDRQVSSARVWEACKLWITRWTAIGDEVSVITHAFWLEGSITPESSKAQTSLKLPPPQCCYHFLYCARLVSRPAAIPGSRVRARGPVYQHPAAVAAQLHGVALHAGAAAEQGGATWGNPDPAAEI